jgi:hypothetical protein
VTVFVDDAVQGRLPGVCVRTGAPADALERLEQPISSFPYWLLIFFGPIGWVVALVLSVRRGEVLTVRLPVDSAAPDDGSMWRQVRLVGWAVLAGAVVFGVGVGPSAALLLTVGLVALVAIVYASARLYAVAIDVRLDASRRWVTLSNVHPNFVEAVQRSTSVRTSPGG